MTYKQDLKIRAAELAAGGRSALKIAAELGVHETTVRKWLRTERKPAGARKTKKLEKQIEESVDEPAQVEVLLDSGAMVSGDPLAVAALLRALEGK